MEQRGPEVSLNEQQLVEKYMVVINLTEIWCLRELNARRGLM